MKSKEPREYVAVRLSLAGVERVKELAAVETEGNLSQMIRKLLAEALTHRERQK